MDVDNAEMAWFRQKWIHNALLVQTRFSLIYMFSLSFVWEVGSRIFLLAEGINFHAASG